MYKNILIISDNPEVALKFEHLLCRKKIKTVKWTFAISPLSQKTNFKFKNKKRAVCYNLRNHKDVCEIVRKFDLVLSLHCKQLFPVSLIKKVKCINIHPGYNPINRGWYPHVFSILYDLPIGATIHEIDKKLDHGKIIDRGLVEKYLFDTGEDLYKRVIKKEFELLNNNLENIIRGRYTSLQPELEGKVYLKKDFDDLRRINLHEKATMLSFINKLRALTNSKYRNAYFIEPKTGKKIFISLNLVLED
jgi:methionyl-tRNA formyltransferase